MYCSRRGREVSRPTDTCKRCGRCNWERDNGKAGKGALTAVVFIAVVVLLAAVLFLMR